MVTVTPLQQFLSENRADILQPGLAWKLLSVEDYDTVLELLPDCPDDPIARRILAWES